MSTDSFTHIGSNMEVSEGGLVLTKKNGSNYNRHCACSEVLSSGVHTWEIVMTSGAISNGQLSMMVGVSKEGLDVEKGNHNKKGSAWYMYTSDGSLCGGDKQRDDEQGKNFGLGDRVGCRLDFGDGSLKFYCNGKVLGPGFPAGTITEPVVRAVELVCPGQSVTLTLTPSEELA